MPLNESLERIVRRLDHALTNTGVRYHAYPLMRAATLRGITVWVCRSDADFARSIMVRLGLIEPSPTAKERILAVRCDMHGPAAPSVLSPRARREMNRLFSILDRFFVGPPGRRTSRACHSSH